MAIKIKKKKVSKKSDPSLEAVAAHVGWTPKQLRSVMEAFPGDDEGQSILESPNELRDTVEKYPVFHDGRFRFGFPYNRLFNLLFGGNPYAGQIAAGDDPALELRDTPCYAHTEDGSETLHRDRDGQWYRVHWSQAVAGLLRPDAFLVLVDFDRDELPDGGEWVVEPYQDLWDALGE